MKLSLRILALAATCVIIVCVLRFVEVRGEMNRQLVLAAKRSDIPLARSSLRAGADPNTLWNGDDRSAGAAIYDKFLHVIGKRICGAEPTEKTPLLLAASKGDGEMVNLLLGMGADPNKRTHRMEYTPLEAGIRANNMRIIGLLLSQGGDPNLTGRSGETPLILSVGLNNRNAVDGLLSNL